MKSPVPRATSRTFTWKVPPLKLAKTRTADGLELDGLVAAADSDICVVHVHGKCGNFYQNSFVGVMAEEYVRQGVSFAAFNNRGHHCVAEAYSDAGLTYVGGSVENPSDCLLDIDSALKAALDQCGATSVILQGHSSGCEKVVFACQSISDSIAGVILLSPADSRALQAEWRAEHPPHLLPVSANALVLDMTSYGVAGEAGYPIPVSQDSLAFVESSSLTSTFAGNQLPALPVRSIAYIGGSDVLQRPHGATWSAKRNAHDDACRIITIDNGDHHFHGYERELAVHLAQWVLVGALETPISFGSGSIREMM